MDPESFPGPGSDPEEVLELIRGASEQDARELCADVGLLTTNAWGALPLQRMRERLLAHYSPAAAPSLGRGTQCQALAAPPDRASTSGGVTAGRAGLAVGEWEAAELIREASEQDARALCWGPLSPTQRGVWVWGVGVGGFQENKSKTAKKTKHVAVVFPKTRQFYKYTRHRMYDDIEFVLLSVVWRFATTTKSQAYSKLAS